MFFGDCVTEVGITKLVNRKQQAIREPFQKRKKRLQVKQEAKYSKYTQARTSLYMFNNEDTHRLSAP